MKHIVALSGGKDSTAMALRLSELEPNTDFTYVCTPTGDELPEMYAHWRKLGDLLGKQITPVMHPLGLNGLIEKQQSLPNWRQRWCTRMIKIEPYAAWLLQHSPCTSYVGLRADEEEREGGDYMDVPGVVMRFPMREWGWGIAEVRDYLAQRGVEIPKRTDCARCFFQRLGEWRDLWQEHPDVYEDAVQQEVRVGATFRSPGRDRWPADLAGLRQEFESGRSIRGDKSNPLKCRVCRI